MPSHAPISSPEKQKLQDWDSEWNLIQMFLFLLFSHTSIVHSPDQYTTVFNWPLPSLLQMPDLVRNKVVSPHQYLSSSAVLRSKALGCPCAILTVSRASFPTWNKKKQLCRNHPFSVKTPAVSLTSLHWRSSASLCCSCANTAVSCCPVLELWPRRNPLSWQLIIDL